MDANKIYLLLHLVGVMMTFIGFGALIARATLAPDHVGVRKLGSITSGIGLFLILLGGFGMLARLYDNQFFWWVIVKIVIWVALGGLTAVVNRQPKLSKPLFFVIIILGAIAGYLGIHFGAVPM